MAKFQHKNFLFQHVICLCDSRKIRWCYQPPSGDKCMLIIRLVLVVGLGGWGPSRAFLFGSLSALEVFHIRKALPDFLPYFDVML